MAVHFPILKLNREFQKEKHCSLTIFLNYSLLGLIIFKNDLKFEVSVPIFGKNYWYKFFHEKPQFCYLNSVTDYFRLFYIFFQLLFLSSRFFIKVLSIETFFSRKINFYVKLFKVFSAIVGEFYISQKRSSALLPDRILKTR